MEQTESPSSSTFATEPIGRLIVKFAIPCVISLLVNSLYNIVDQIFIGWGVGYLGNGATNIVFPITIVALSLSLMIGDGGAAYLSLKLGEGDIESAKKGVGNAIVLVTVVSILLAAVFLIGFQTVVSVYLQAVGKPIKSAILSLARQIIFFVPAALILPRFLGGGRRPVDRPRGRRTGLPALPGPSDLRAQPAESGRARLRRPSHRMIFPVP